jgi:hypothetical protein
MGNCNNKIKNTCGGRTFAGCVDYEGDLPEFTTVGSCPTIEETTEEIYKEVDEIRTATNLSGLGELCLSYTLVDGKVIVKNALAKFEQEICSLKQQILILQTTSICNTSIVPCNLEWGDLVNECGLQPQTLGQTLQLLINNTTQTTSG